MYYKTFLQEDIPTYFNILYSNYIFAIPIIFFIYSIYAWHKYQDNFMTNIKRVYYSFALLMYFVFIRYENVSMWCIAAPLGIIPEIWSYLFSMIVAVLIAISIDNFIISGYVFKELGFFGAKFIREDIKKDTKDTVIEQNDLILSLENNLELMYDIPLLIDSIFELNNVYDDISENFNSFTQYFSNILKTYYSLKNEIVSIEVSFYEYDDIETIIKKYRTNFNGTITDKNIKDLRKCLNGEIEGTYLTLGDHRIYAISKTITLLSKNRELFISIKALDDVNVLDIYPIFNFLYIFMLKLSYSYNDYNVVDTDFA